MSAPAVYRSGRKKGLPKFCECGGKMLYQFDLGVTWSCCDTCTPVVRNRRVQPFGPGGRAEMSEYIKIQTLWLRDPATNHKTLLRGEWAKPEFQYLASALWVWTEKVDGTNIRVIWDGERVRFGGKTDAAQVPTPLLAHLMDVFTPERLAAALKGPLVLYGEGYGPKIQKGGGRYRDDPGFILFDALAVDTWLERGTVEEIAGALAIPVAPIIGSGSLWEAAAIVEDGYLSQIAKDPTLIAEGFVMRPAVELKNRRGERVIAKVKHNDFASSHILADSQSGAPGEQT